jgi:glucuronosyltransferase
MVDVAGLQIKPQPDPLPSDIQAWLDGADHGVILFSLGSNVKSTSMSKKQLAAILNVFSTLKQRVLLKWETDDLPNRPANVKIFKWMPQDDVLAHKNVKLFITHGGMGSVAEAKFHGVPIIGIPFYGDQSANVALAVQEGWGIHIEISELSEGLLKAAIDEVLTNPRYRAEVKAKADLYRDRPQDALTTAVFWVEYVMRHKGAAHMRSPLLDMNFFEQNSLDVLAFLGLVVYIACKLMAIMVRFAWKLLRGKNKKTKTS